MADSKISALAALVGTAAADGDEFVVVDKSDTSMAVSGTTKRITFAELVKAMASRDIALDQWGSVGGFLP